MSAEQDERDIDRLTESLLVTALQFTDEEGRRYPVRIDPEMLRAVVAQAIKNPPKGTTP